MISPNLIVNLRRIVIASMTIALAITSSILLMKKAPLQGDFAEINRAISGYSGNITASSKQSESDNGHVASVVVIILNNGKEFPSQSRRVRNI